MKRTYQHVMEDRAAQILGELLPDEWIMRPILKDYGVDYEVELVDEEEVSGNRIWIQLKAVKKCNILTRSYEVKQDFSELLGIFPEMFPDYPNIDNFEGRLNVKYASFSIDTKELTYALKCAFPLLLLLVDLNTTDIYWLPLRDEVICSLSYRNPHWSDRKTATVHVPLWNSIKWEKEHNYPGLRWYALEPARTYAFTMLYRYYRDFEDNKYLIELHGDEIDDEGIDPYLKQNLKDGLQKARDYLTASLELTILFGENGIDFYRVAPIPTTQFDERRPIAAKLEEALTAATTALDLLDRGGYHAMEMFVLITIVIEAGKLLSRAITMYRGFQQRFLLMKGVAVWRAGTVLYGFEGSPMFPMKRQKPEDT